MTTHDSTISSLIVRLIYGIELQEESDEYFKMVERITDVAEDIAVPGRYAVEAFPSLQFLPSWLPGMHFKQYAENAKREISGIVSSLLEKTKDDIVSFYGSQHHST